MQLGELDFGIFRLIGLFGFEKREFETGEFGHGTRDAIGEIAVFDGDGGDIRDCGRHLRGDESPPNEVIEFILIAREVFFYRFWGSVDVRGSNGLVCVLNFDGFFLGIFDGFVVNGFGGEIIFPVVISDIIAASGDGFVGDADRVGTDIGDETDGTVGDIDAFEEFLSDARRRFRGKAELTRGATEEIRRRERRVCARLSAFDFDLGDDKGTRF